MVFKAGAFIDKNGFGRVFRSVAAVDVEAESGFGSICGAEGPCTVSTFCPFSDTACL